MEKKQSFRTRIVGLRLTAEEYQHIESKFKQSTARKLSEYVRRVLFDKPITVNRRNQSLDDFMAELILLRNELNGIGNNFNQAIKRLHTLEKIPEFREWIISYEVYNKALLNKVNEIKIRINKIADEWLQ